MEQKRILPMVLVFILPILVITFFRDISNVDELWNYTFADNMADGLLPYRDFNLLQTPFSCLVNSVLLKIFGRHLLVIRLAGALLFFLVCFFLYKICRYLGAGATEACLVPFGFLAMFFWDVFFEYNVLILLLLLAGMAGDIYACHYKRQGIPHIFTGILMGLAILSKQTYGFFVAAGSCISGMIVEAYLLGQQRNIYLKQNGKFTGKGFQKRRKGSIFKAFGLRILGIAIPCSIFLFYLLLTGTMGNFLDMCLFGIKEFSGIYAYTSFMMENPGYFIGGVLFPLLAIACVIYICRIGGEKRIKMGILLLYGVTGCISIYPLANSYHVALSAIPFLPALFLIIPSSFFGRKPVRILKWTAILAALIFLIIAVPIINCKDAKLCSIRHYEFTFVKEDSLEEINEVISLVKEKEKEGGKVYILDNYARLYFIPLDRYHNGLDMFLLGNLGARPPADWIKEVEVPGKTLFLVPGDDRENWQFPYDDLNERKKTWKFMESVSDLDLYKVE